MTISSLRKLGQLGVNTDVDPLELPLGSFTMAVNARFEYGSISRGPVFNTGSSLSNSAPKYVVSYKTLSGSDSLIICNADGTMQSWTPGGTEVSMTATGWSAAAFDQPYTSCISNNMVYINRPDRQPWYMQKGNTQFTVLPVWPTTWRCAALRSYNGQLIALNVTQGGVQYPSMVAWSDYTVWDSWPQYWTASATNAAGSNVLPDLGDPLVDGLALRNVFILYSQMETWLMQSVGQPLIFSFARLFDNNYGLISQNCVVEVSNIHYVFGLDKIWKHDGYTPQDISSGRVKDFIYHSIDLANSSQFFVTHQPRLAEVMFCYRSTDSSCAFPINGTTNYQGCNRAAVYNYRADTWYFYDLPYVTNAGYSGLAPGMTYAGEGSASYASAGGSYSSYGDPARLGLYMTIQGTTGGAKINSFELQGSVYASGLVDLPATAPVSLYVSQLDLDEVGAKLRGYKVLKSIYPMGRIDPGAQPIMFDFGSGDYPNSPPPVLGTPMSFDGSSLYKLDFMTAGRYMSMQITFNDYRNFSLSGLDVDFEITGNR